MENYEALLELEDVAHGLSARELASLPQRRVTEGNTDDDGQPNLCCICCCEFAPGDLQMMLHCKHSFHPECIGTWLRAKRTCPVCKQSAIGEATTEDD